MNDIGVKNGKGSHEKRGRSKTAPFFEAALEKAAFTKATKASISVSTI
jgi:hypothetical protein